MKQFLQTLLVTVAAAALVSCGGDDGSLTAAGTATGGTGGAGGGGAGGPVDPTTITVEMGSGTPPNFTAGILGVAVSNLAAGGSSSLTVTFVTSQNVLYTEDVSVVFSSPCIASDLATITGNTSTSTGVLTVTYGATGCAGDDVITATAVVDGSQLSATGSINVAASTVGSIEFQTATPSKIGLRGTGGVGIPETSTVVFRVVDATGGPSIGREVSFDLNTTAGGITLTPTTAISGSNGEVQTVVQSGTVATTIRVTATVTDVTPNIGSQSSELTITTGLPDQNSVSLAVETINVEGWVLDGTQNPVTVRLSDRFNNPVPDGTAVTLSTEGGKIAGSCTTETSTDESGFCTVNWVSQNPRPVDLPAGGPFTSRAGRSEIYMTTIGEESFTDANGNGYFDDGDPWIPGGTDPNDMGEPYLDEDESGAYELGEPYFDFNNNSTRDGPDGFYSGLLCGGPDGTEDTRGYCAPNATTAISASNLIIMSGSTAVITVTTPNPAPQNSSVCYYVRDVNDQPMPAGTTISITDAINGSIVGPSSYTVPSTADDSQGGNTYCFFISDPELNTPIAGNMFLTVEVPSGLQTLNSSVCVEDAGGDCP